MSHIIDRVSRKIQAGERLDSHDALELFQTDELIEIGRLANQVNFEKNNGQVFYNVNRHINPTNICVLSCKFCAYSRKPGEEGSYAYTIDQMVEKAGEARKQGATEVHMVGGLHPRWSFDHYKDMVAAIKKAFPDLHLKAFTVVELDWMARKARKTIGQVLEELVEAGLGSLPGGGAEIFHPEIRDQICDTKVSAEQWLETHRLAHSLGLHSNATMLYGHIESFFHRVDHMERLRRLQDQTGGFNAFIPLSFQPFQNDMGIEQYTYGFDDLKTIAIARLFLDSFPHVKAYWIMLGQDIAQLALQFGANDLDGTVTEEKISRMAGGRAGMAMTRTRIKDIIRKASRTPVERDTLYNPMEVTKENTKPSGQREALERLYHKLSYDPQGLTLEELCQLGSEDSLHALGGIATAYRDQQVGLTKATFALTHQLNLDLSSADMLAELEQTVAHCHKQLHMGPSTASVDLGSRILDGDQDFDLAALGKRLWSVKQTFPDLEISIWGFKTLWALAQKEDLSITDLLGFLRQQGVDIVESSPGESESDLTHSEIVEIHRQAHANDMRTTCKAQLAVPAGGRRAQPLWDIFLGRIEALDQLNAETGGLASLAVTVDRDSFVTVAEYVKAVAMARLACRSVENIASPFMQIPTLSPQKGLGTKLDQHPAEKVASLMLHFGASDLGHIDPAILNPCAILQQIRAAGYEPEMRDCRYHPLRQPDATVGLWQNLRHLPMRHGES